MNDFLQQVEKLKSAINTSIDIAKGTVADTIDAAEFINEAMESANKCFTGGMMSPMQMIARKDAYDYTIAVSRAADMHSFTRAKYYADAAESLKKISTEREEFNKAAILTCEKAGA